MPVGVALYHAKNSVTNDLEPYIEDFETDWVLYTMPDWVSDWGVTSATQSDLTYHAWDHVDSHAQRKILQDNPTITVAFGGIYGDIPENPNTRKRCFDISYVIRTLYRIQLPD
jgi:hypothetical protein